jgi:proteasome lid subunit RPN8/RPN11
MLKLTQKAQEEIHSHGSATYPYEGCGLLLGAVQDGGNRVTAVFTVENRWPAQEERRERFHITADDMLQAELAAMHQGLEVVGVFHSHPDCPPVASPRDLAWAAWPGYSYLITEVRQGRPATSRSWQLLPDRSGFCEEEIELEDQAENLQPLTFNL